MFLQYFDLFLQNLPFQIKNGVHWLPWSQAVLSRLYCFLSVLRLAIALIFKLVAVFGKKNWRLNCEAKSERCKQTKCESGVRTIFLLVIANLVHITKTTREEAVFSNFFNWQKWWTDYICQASKVIWMISFCFFYFLVLFFYILIE